MKCEYGGAVSPDLALISFASLVMCIQMEHASRGFPIMHLGLFECDDFATLRHVLLLPNMWFGFVFLFSCYA